MTVPGRAVIIRQMPLICGGKEGKAFVRELADAISACIRPNVVVDCSGLRAADKGVMHLLLCCLEEAMKRNGDVRLAAVQPEVRVVLEGVGVDRLFRIFGSITEAVQSYRKPAIVRARMHVTGNADQPAANAA